MATARKIFTALAALSAGATITACGMPNAQTAPQESSRSSTESAVAVYELPPDWGSDAGLAEGVLVDVDGCIRLDNSRVPIFPMNQATWDGDTLRFGEKQYRVGDTIRFAANELGEPSSLETQIPEGCSAGPFWVVGPHRG